jgi:uncharacterized protein (AIM24 family)
MYRVEGELVPVLHMGLDGQMPVYFEHHVILWKSPTLEVGMHQMKGAFKRIIAGMPIFMTEARGPGEIAFSRDGVGHIIAMHLQQGQGIVVREHQFLAATANVEYTFNRVKGIGNMLFGGTGFFVDSFVATAGEGVVWLHGYGNVFDKTLGPGEAIDIEPGGWIYRDYSVQMQQQVYGLKTGIFGGSGNLIFNRFIGPGRVGVQSMYVHLPTAE